ncbi:membrane protein FdrA [Serratia proteamaculans]|uniref:Acyl-CoA synthetase FdrA n=1 Tax=Serratia proteamaculans TaxID=28151 RepID=A0ABS0TLI0_SERPR|nr:acyl-CoA synthetase FdrA [Serratia proteamaculans]MBI6179214.1 acyl-CoA synthetase FdrA [Serratia proteamaculans]RYM51899.1 acyl-CoA synthetase FdrA [Serratia proteamaculans]RYM54429.1 acyl-CoA synthetase FdrA [Serratia proteamaculans]CAI1175766.1 membrane protein FdrA [Serratia proteamaculans]CAI2457493.1 membrane protein FdrA [Serratia proteamaculans]
MIHAFIKKGSFQDSVSLMLISRKLSESPNVEEISVMMGTPANKSLLEVTGFWHPQFNEATPNDICVAIKAESDGGAIVDEIGAALDAALKAIAQGSQGGKKLLRARSWRTARQKLPNANLTLISIAGEYAAELADRALDDGCNVMMFSDNVSIEQEVALKTKASGKGLIVMGPDCGTACIAGAPLAFANVAPQGVIGIIGASGTGIQELISQITLAGQAISHAIGLGGRDLTAEIGGISAVSALRMLAADPQSRVLAFVSKPPAATVRQKVIDEMKALGKPVVALFLGTKAEVRQDGNLYFADTLDEAARLAAMLGNVQQQAERQPAVPGGKITGLYAGGTLAAECAMLLAEKLRLPIDSEHRRGSMLAADGHRIIDMGDDFYTQGRPHPMIDPAARNHEIASLAQQPQVGVLLLDVVIGFGAQQDPAASLAAEVIKLREQRGAAHPLAVIATVTGTEQDPQQRSRQIASLDEAGIAVAQSLPEAVALAHQLVSPTCPVTERPLPELLSGVAVINAGLRSFADDLQTSEIAVVHYQWAPVAGGNQRLANLLKKLK